MYVKCLLPCVYCSHPYSQFNGQIVSTTYPSISRTVHNLSDISPFPSISTIVLNFPTTKPEVLQSFKAHFFANPVSPNKKRVAVIDSIISHPGVLLPWKEMVQSCREEGVWSVIDAAHSIGHEVDLDLEKARPDFCVSVGYSLNCPLMNFISLTMILFIELPQMVIW